MTALPFTLERTLVIRAEPDVVFRFFTDTARWARWWGAGSFIEATPGGRMHIRYPDGTEADGEVVDIAEPERIIFTYGYATGKQIPPGGSRVSIRLASDADGTRVTLTHEFADEAARDHHVQGWRYQLSLFSNIVADEVNADAAAAVDAWFDAWGIADDTARRAALQRIASPAIRFNDRFSAVEGLSDLVPHIGAALRFMPGLRLQRTGDIRHCQGTVLAEWTATSADGRPIGSGTNVFVFGAGGGITSAVGFWRA